MKDPIIVELWEDYKEAVKKFGYGNEAKEIVMKIVSLTPSSE